MNDDSIAKTIADLEIETKNVITPLEALRKKFESIDGQIAKTQGILDKFGKGVAVNVGDAIAGGARKAEDEIKKVTQSTINQLAQIEKALSATAKTAGGDAIRVHIPGEEQHRAVVKALQDQLQVGQEISKETAKQIRDAQHFAQLKTNHISTLRNEIEIAKQTNAQHQILHDSQQRSDLAKDIALKQQQTAQAKIAEATMRDNMLQQQNIAMLNTKVASTLKQWEIQKMSDDSIANGLSMYRAQLQQIQAQLNSGKVLNKVETERLQKLKEQTNALIQQANATMADAAQRKAVQARIDAGVQAAKKQRAEQEKAAQAIMRENSLQQQNVFMMEQKAAATLKQLAAQKLTDHSVAQQLTTLRGQIQQYQQLLATGKVLSSVETDRLRNLQMQLNILQAQAKTVMADMPTKAVGGAFEESVLADQWRRKISWFTSGAIFYGGIRAMKAAVAEFQNVETSMVVIERVANDVTFSLEKVRKELIEVGKEYGHTWDSVQEVAIRWTQAGYSINDVIELTRISLLGLNVAEMDLNMATQGLISIMSQWDYTASDLETVIDKLNITSDNYAVTTGDLVEGLLRSSGAARALGLSFEETVGLITATRVASGRLGAEVGNALNTLLAFITRQSTLNKMMEAGINVFADAAGTTLRPALDILNDVVERWQDNAESMPMAMVEIADEMGIMSEEMAEVIGLTDEWTQLQKLELEQSMAGVRRRNFLIALMRNFAMAQEVVNGMTESHGYSMEQNAKAMETLEKKYNQLKITATELAVSIGDAGVMGQMKRVTDKTRGAVEWFNSLDNTVKTAVISFIQLTVALKLVNSLLAMGGVSAASGVIGTLSALKSVPGALMGIFGGPWGLLATGASVALMTIVNNVRKYNAELEVSAKNSKELSIEIETLKNRYVELAEKVDKTESETEEFANVTNALTNLLPHAITGFDEMGNAISNVATITETATQKTKELKAEYESFVKAQAAVAKARIPGLEKELGLIEGQYEKLAETTRLGAPFARGALLTDKSMEGKSVMERLSAALRGETGAIAQWKAHFADDSEVMKMAEDKLKSLRNQMESTRQEIAEYEAALKVVEELGKTPEPTAGGGGKPSPGFPDPKKTDEIGKSISKLTDLISRYIETALRAADVQGMLNDETQRTIDGYRAKIDYLTRDNATASERVEALRLEVDLTEKLREKQEGVHQEANFLRETLAKLEQYQKGVNTETEEGWEAYKKLESQIESVKGTIEKLGIEWFNLAKAQEETIVQTKTMQDALKDLDFYARLGVMTVEEQLAKTRGIYNELSRARAMTVAEEYDMIQRQHSAYKQMLLDMKKDAEEAYRERIKLLEKETEQAIALIQKQIDALSEEETQDKREEERRQHEEKLQELYEKRRYHELRTGREHSQAILDVDKQLDEEQRRWEQRQAEWTREDKRRSLQQQIQDIKDSAQKQKEKWQETYEAMQRDFSDYNISLLALAATFDPDFWEDAKNKGELWTKGFKDGTVGFIAYLEGLIAKAKGINLQLGGGYYGGGDYGGTYWDSGGNYAGGSGSGTGQYVGGGGDDHSWEVIDHGDHYYVPGIGDVPKGARGGVLDSPRFVFAGEAGNEALIPLDKLQPMLSDALSNSILTNELIFPPNLSAQLGRLVGALTARPLTPAVAQEQWRSSNIDKRVSVAGNLLNIENANFEDDADIEIMSRELRRQIDMLR